MKCDQIAPYLPGFVGGDLRTDTTRIVQKHVSGCARCSGESARLQRVRSSLSSISEQSVEPPPFLLESIIERVHERSQRRALPMVPVAPTEVVRLVTEHKEAIASAAGTALVAAGAAYALWRAVRGARTPRPATS